MWQIAMKPGKPLAFGAVRRDVLVPHDPGRLEVVHRDEDADRGAASVGGIVEIPNASGASATGVSASAATDGCSTAPGSCSRSAAITAVCSSFRWQRRTR